MIELIDQEYGNFVDLSTNLAGAHGVVQKLNLEAREIIDDVEPSATEVKLLIDQIDSAESERSKNLEQQKLLCERMEFYSALKRIEKLMNSIKSKLLSL